MIKNWQRTTIIILGLWLVIQTAALGALFQDKPLESAAVGMRWSLIFLWIVIVGGLTYWKRDWFKAKIQSNKISWPKKFILLATALALLEELIAISINNSAPSYGIELGLVNLTATTNYLDLILFHSVIVFIPMFIAWAQLLKKYDFSPFAVFMLFGLSGMLAEASLGGLGLFEFAQWIFVYGLMVYLPAYAIPRERGALPPKKRHYLWALIFPLIAAFVVAFLLRAFFPEHPTIHF